MKKNWGSILFERILFVIIGLLLIFVCTTGYWVYDRLAQVSESPLPTNLKENRRFIVRDLNSNILKSDNLTYSYLYQNNPNALLDFEILESQTNRKMALLQSYKEGQSGYQKQINKLDSLVKTRFFNLDTLMSIKNENRVNETMAIVQNAVQNASETAKIKMEIRDQVNALQTPQVQPQEEEAKKKMVSAKEQKSSNSNYDSSSTSIQNQSFRHCRRKHQRNRQKDSIGKKCGCFQGILPEFIQTATRTGKQPVE